MLQELLFTDVGILSLITIILMIVGTFWLYRWTEKKVEKDTAAKRERDKARAQQAQKA
ncbi:MAG: DUF3149 domain-containing protein [Burkholderiales bacterium]|jgi:Na+/H+ antiporter NhaD/arsenite permease-like protein|nr:DUF3149 domain-containing protein [Burkholderiales bacterium]